MKGHIARIRKKGNNRRTVAITLAAWKHWKETVENRYIEELIEIGIAGNRIGVLVQKARWTFFHIVTCYLNSGKPVPQSSRLLKGVFGKEYRSVVMDVLCGMGVLNDNDYDKDKGLSREFWPAEAEVWYELLIEGERNINARTGERLRKEQRAKSSTCERDLIVIEGHGIPVSDEAIMICRLKAEELPPAKRLQALWALHLVIENRDENGIYKPAYNKQKGGRLGDVNGLLSVPSELRKILIKESGYSEWDFNGFQTKAAAELMVQRGIIQRGDEVYNILQLGGQTRKDFTSDKKIINEAFKRTNISQMMGGKLPRPKTAKQLHARVKWSLKQAPKPKSWTEVEHDLFKLCDENPFIYELQVNRINKVLKPLEESSARLREVLYNEYNEQAKANKGIYTLLCGKQNRWKDLPTNRKEAERKLQAQTLQSIENLTLREAAELQSYSENPILHFQYDGFVVNKLTLLTIELEGRIQRLTGLRIRLEIEEANPEPYNHLVIEAREIQTDEEKLQDLEKREKKSIKQSWQEKDKLWLTQTQRRNGHDYHAAKSGKSTTAMRQRNSRATNNFNQELKRRRRTEGERLTIQEKVTQLTTPLGLGVPTNPYNLYRELAIDLQVDYPAPPEINVAQLCDWTFHCQLYEFYDLEAS